MSSPGDYPHSAKKDEIPSDVIPLTHVDWSTLINVSPVSRLRKCGNGLEHIIERLNIVRFRISCGTLCRCLCTYSAFKRDRWQRRET